MKIIKEGHTYLADHLGGNNQTEIQFVDRGHGCDTEGTTNQELLRILIDRVKFLNEELPWDGNEHILKSLRMALILHESRALVRKVEKDEINPENIITDEKDGHFLFKSK